MNSRSSWTKVLRLVVAGLLGYALIVLLTTLGFVEWLDNASLYQGDGVLKAKGMLVALVAGLAGGTLAGLIGRRRPFLHALAILPLLVIDTIYVLFFFPRTDPIWFDLGGSLGLITATLVGGWVVAVGPPRLMFMKTPCV